MDNKGTSKKNGFMEHQFVARLIEDIFYFYSSQQLESATYKYCKNVQHQLTKTNRSLETMQLIRLLVAEKHPAIPVDENTAIEREAILSYHLGNYFRCLHSFNDDIVQLMAAIYEWPIPEGNEAAPALLKRAKAEGVAHVEGIVTAAGALLGKASPLRSDITDKTGMSDSDISLIESVKEAENLLKHSFGSKDTYDEDMNEYYTLTVANNLTEMQEIEGGMEGIMHSLLGSLFSTYAAKVPETNE